MRLSAIIPVALAAAPALVSGAEPWGLLLAIRRPTELASSRRTTLMTFRRSDPSASLFVSTLRLIAIRRLRFCQQLRRLGSRSSSGFGLIQTHHTLQTRLLLFNMHPNMLSRFMLLRSALKLYTVATLLGIRYWPRFKTLSRPFLNSRSGLQIAGTSIRMVLPTR